MLKWICFIFLDGEWIEYGFKKSGNDWTCTKALPDGIVNKQGGGGGGGGGGGTGGVVICSQLVIKLQEKKDKIHEIRTINMKRKLSKIYSLKQQMIIWLMIIWYLRCTFSPWHLRCMIISTYDKHNKPLVKCFYINLSMWNNYMDFGHI